MTAEQDMWEQRYGDATAQQATVWSKDPNRFVVEYLGDLTPGTGVDLACGEGRNALWLAERGWTMTGVDFAAAGIATARRWSQESGLAVDWVQADVTTWEPDTTFDLVLFSYLQLPHRELAGTVQRAAAWLRAGGVLMSIGHDLDNLTGGVGGPKDPEVLHRVDELREAATNAGLHIERAEQILRPVDTDDGPKDAIDTLLLARR